MWFFVHIGAKGGTGRLYRPQPAPALGRRAVAATSGRSFCKVDARCLRDRCQLIGNVNRSAQTAW
ncbi:hypothetical protein RSPO_c00196 [Ralstonia solanacearum Po82]|uniref:Uncharacterized protein n=1 Tax=Ralstonia solanacearum (strain Po82) TaxID=1031711 RepID=F6G6F5_RALS8|nr:hypothetical protein RSPO_c00196 [Ralstonia solanacearum Po82]